MFFAILKKQIWGGKNIALCLMFLLFFGQAAIGATVMTEQQFGSHNSVGELPLKVIPNVTAEDAKAAIEKTKNLIAEIVKNSFPELKNARVEVKIFRSKASYFRASFSSSRFLIGQKLHYKIFVNPQVFELNAPLEGVRAIIAHELSHILYYERHSRFELFGLLSLIKQSFTIRFERGADLEALSRGYGAGLKSYRNWLYQNIAAAQIAKKKKNYFTPEEIDLLGDALRQKPQLIDYWRKKVPRNLAEIRATAGK